jgi:hypothetical protein
MLNTKKIFALFLKSSGDFRKVTLSDSGSNLEFNIRILAENKFVFVSKRNRYSSRLVSLLILLEKFKKMGLI